MANHPSDRPPFLSSWRSLYTIVIGSLLLEIGLFYWFMAYFS